MDDELFAQITFIKNELDNANKRLTALESDRNALIAILKDNNIVIPDEIQKRYDTDEELKIPLE